MHGSSKSDKAWVTLKHKLYNYKVCMCARCQCCGLYKVCMCARCQWCGLYKVCMCARCQCCGLYKVCMCARCRWCGLYKVCMCARCQWCGLTRPTRPSSPWVPGCRTSSTDVPSLRTGSHSANPSPSGSLASSSPKVCYVHTSCIMMKTIHCLTNARLAANRRSHCYLSFPKLCLQQFKQF